MAEKVGQFQDGVLARVCLPNELESESGGNPDWSGMEE